MTEHSTGREQGVAACSFPVSVEPSGVERLSYLNSSEHVVLQVISHQLRSDPQRGDLALGIEAAASQGGQVVVVGVRLCDFRGRVMRRLLRSAFLVPELDACAAVHSRSCMPCCRTWVSVPSCRS